MADEIIPYFSRSDIEATVPSSQRSKSSRRVAHEALEDLPCHGCKGIIAEGELFTMSGPTKKDIHPHCARCRPFSLRGEKTDFDDERRIRLKRVLQQQRERQGTP